MAAPTTDSAKTVLLVDDDPSTRFLLATLLKRFGLRVLDAASADAGQRLIDTHGINTFDLVVSDYWMPGKNGIEFLKSVRHQDLCISVILMTADEEREILETLVNFGDCGYLQKPFSQDALRPKIKQAVEQTTEKRSLRATEVQANQLGENQRLLLKQQLEANWTGIEFSFSSKSQASGDFVSAINMNDGSKILLFSDASGHELSSAFQSNYFHGFARGMLNEDAHIADVFNAFNRVLSEEWNENHQVNHSLAACAIRFAPDNRKAKFLNAGFPPPLFATLDGFATPLGDAQGAPPLGWFDDPYTLAETTLHYGTLIAWTDGLDDLAAETKVDSLALADRLLNTEQDTAHLIARSKDDIAVIRAKIPGTPEQSTPSIPIFAQKYSGSRIEDIDTIQTLSENSIRYALPSLDSGSLSEILVCLREALINALKHGCQNRNDKFATLQISRSEDRSKISIQIRDEGNGHSFDWGKHAEHAAEQLLTEHRGLIMMQTIPSRTQVRNHGAHVLMEFEHVSPNN